LIRAWSQHIHFIREMKMVDRKWLFCNFRIYEPKRFYKKIVFLYVILSLSAISYQAGQKMELAMEGDQYTNRLIHESSPYLLLHAHNPVDWYPWGEEALKHAKDENKLLIISIGYSACHWCHVMEKESFQDTSVARLMNTYFIPIKIDREERPDLDQIYMQAARLITGKSGWPLHVIALPDGRPVYAGTYYPKENWKSLLSKISAMYIENPKELEETAAAVTEGIQKLDILNLNQETADLKISDLDSIYDGWKDKLDVLWGGLRGTPKFPMPAGMEFLLRYYFLTQKPEVLDAVKTNLDRMALGGIYDQIGGGFARYAVDAYWKIPHFEKMLYDNAQLISLYSSAYQLTKDPLYKEVVDQTVEFTERELTSPEGGFYSSIDADSEGEEGKYYVWHQKEIEEILGKQAKLVMDYYHISGFGNWEEGKNVLCRRYNDELFAKKYNMKTDVLKKNIEEANEKLYKIRSKRIHPAVDDKILTSWNALMLKAFVDAYRVFNKEDFLKRALENAEFLQENMVAEDGQIQRSYHGGEITINGFLDDYALMIQAYIGLYQATFNEDWLSRADVLTGYALKHFYDQDQQLFYYTSDLDPKLIARKMEIPDQVVPSSNSVMAENLFLLGTLLDRPVYIDYSRKMVMRVKSHLYDGGPYYGNWSRLLVNFVSPLYEVVIVGSDANKKRRELDEYFLPDVILSGSMQESALPLLHDRYIKGKTLIYVCQNGTCQLPVEKVEDAILLIKQ